jgi:hypothetical protein
MTISVSVPLIPYLYKFLLWKERLAPGDLLDLIGSKGDVAYVLGGMLTTKVQARYDDTEKLSDTYTEEIRVKLDTRRLNSGRVVISDANVRMFNQFLRKNLHELLLERIMNGMRHKQKECNIIYDFIRELGMEDDVSFDTLKKAQTRLRKSKKIPAFRSHNRRRA